MAFKNILGRKEEPDEYLELEFEEDEPSGKKITVKVEKLVSYADSDRIQQRIREGMVLLVDIKKLKESNMADLKRAIERLKKTATAMNGEIAGLGDNWVIITPQHAVIHREKEQQ